MNAGELKIVGTQLYWGTHSAEERWRVGTIDEDLDLDTGEPKVHGDYLAYQDDYGDPRKLLGILTGEEDTAGRLGPIKGNLLYYVDHDGYERVLQIKIYTDKTGWIRHYDYPPPTFSWDELRAEEGTDVMDVHDVTYMVNVVSWSVTDKWLEIYRYYMCFDTSSLESEDIEEAKIHFYVIPGTKLDTLGMAPSIALYSFSPINFPTIEVEDYQSFGSTPLSDPLAWGDIVEGWNILTLNEDGIAAINKYGYTHFGIRIDRDVSGIDPTWYSIKRTRFQIDRKFPFYDPSDTAFFLTVK